MTAADVDTLGSRNTCSKSDRYWSEDGELILKLGRTLFRVKKSLWTSTSKLTSVSPISVGLEAQDMPNCGIFEIPDSLGIDQGVLTLLLDYLHGGLNSTELNPVSKLSPLLHATSPAALDLEETHEKLRDHCQTLCPSGPNPYVLKDNLQDLLILAYKYDLPKVKKSVLYKLTTSDVSIDSTKDNLPELDIDFKIENFMQRVIDLFSPILFTVGTAGHIQCTEVFADQWMPLVIQPALDDDGVYKPLETLQRIIDIDWPRVGLCEECTSNMRAEWSENQGFVWNKMDAWI